MEAEMFDKFIAPNVTVLKFDGHSFYLSEQIDEAVFFLIEESPVDKDFTLHLVE